MKKKVDFKKFFKGFEQVMDKLQKLEEKRISDPLSSKIVKKEIEMLEEVERYIAVLDNNRDIFNDYLESNYRNNPQVIRAFDINLEQIANLLYRDKIKEELENILEAGTQQNVSFMKKMVFLVVLGVTTLNIAGNAFASTFEPIEKASVQELIEFEQFKLRLHIDKLTKEYARLGLRLDEEEIRKISNQYNTEIARMQGNSNSDAGANRYVSSSTFSMDNVSPQMQDLYKKPSRYLGGNDLNRYLQLRESNGGQLTIFRLVCVKAISDKGYQSYSQVTPQDFVNALRNFQ